MYRKVTAIIYLSEWFGFICHSLSDRQIVLIGQCVSSFDVTLLIILTSETSLPTSVQKLSTACILIPVFDFLFPQDSVRKSHCDIYIHNCTYRSDWVIFILAWVNLRAFAEAPNWSRKRHGKSPLSSAPDLPIWYDELLICVDNIKRVEKRALLSWLWWWVSTFLRVFPQVSAFLRSVKRSW